MRWMVVCAALVLAACAPKAQLVGQCKFEALKRYEATPNEIAANEYIQTCMEAKGYEWSVGKTHCSFSGNDSEREASCYYRMAG